MGSRSKQKGSQFERNICRQLSLWVSHGESNNLFWRSSQSGGRATTLRKKGEDLSIQAGDIAAIDPAGKPFTDVFFVECKHYRTLRFDQMLYGHLGVLGTMWIRCLAEAAKYGKCPLMIVKENARPILLLTTGGVEPMMSMLRAHFNSRNMYVYYFDDVLRNVDPEAFILGGENANARHGRLASHRQGKRRLSLEVSE